MCNKNASYTREITVIEITYSVIYLQSLCLLDYLESLRVFGCHTCALYFLKHDVCPQYVFHTTPEENVQEIYRCTFSAL